MKWTYSAGMVTLCCLLGCKPRPAETTVVVEVHRVRDFIGDRALPPLDAAKALHITSDALFTVYGQNVIGNVMPDQVFHNAVLLVTGVYNGVRNGPFDRTYLELRTHQEEAFTYAALAPDAQALLANLVPGQKVQLLCRGAGAAAGSPLLAECHPQ